MSAAANSPSLLPRAALAASTADRVLLAAALALPALPNFVYFLTSSPRNFWLGQTLTSLLLCAAPLLLGARPRTALAILAPFALLTPLLAAYAWVTGYAPSLLALQVLREATREELFNFLPAIIACTIASAAVGFAFLGLARHWRGRTLVSPRWLRLAGLTLLLLALGKDLLLQGPRGGSAILLSRLEKLAPLSPLVLAAHLEASGPIIPDRAAVLQRQDVRLDPAAPAREICVLVIGESARRRAFGLYNPELATTPLLAARPLVTFTDAAASGTATIQAVPILMTGRFPDHEILPFKELGLVEAFRLAGFRTHWFSTQEADGEISSFITAFSVNAHEKIFVNGRLERSNRRDPEVKTDAALLPFLAAAVAQPGRHFIVLHTLGSHLPYLRRYPSDFEKWPVAENAKSAMWRWLPPFDAFQREQIDHAYLDSVLFTDSVLDQVIATLESSRGSASMIYLSDHGENDAAAPAMPANHGIVTPDVTAIPFFMWFSPAFEKLHAPAVATLRANRTRAVSAQDLFSTVCELHGIRTSATDPSRSLVNVAYREHPRSILSLDGQTVQLPR